MCWPLSPTDVVFTWVLLQASPLWVGCDLVQLVSMASLAEACAAALRECQLALCKFSFKISFRMPSVHRKYPFKKINKWLKTDFSARGKNYYLTISLMKTEVKYQPALDKQHTKPSITLSCTEQNTLTDFTRLLSLPQTGVHSTRELGPFLASFCLNKDLDRNPLSHFLSQSKFPFLLTTNINSFLGTFFSFTCSVKLMCLVENWASTSGSI